MRRKKQAWKANDVFAVSLKDGEYGIGHVLDLQMSNVVRVAIYNLKVKDYSTVQWDTAIKFENVIALLATTKEQLDYGVWKIIHELDYNIPKEIFPNEQFRKSGWIGAKIYDAALIEKFINAYHGLIFWDSWPDPNYLDKYLINIEKKPKKLMLKPIES